MPEPDVIPQEKRAALAQGLRKAFDVDEFEDIRRITKGRTTALVFRIVVRGSPFLLRIIMRKDLQLGPERHFACMQLAAEAGLAPRVHYTSIEDGLSITDFVEEKPFPAHEALLHMPRILRTLHALPPFPAAESHLNTTCTFLLNRGPAVDQFLNRIATSKLFPEPELTRLFGWHKQLAAGYSQHPPDLVSSHNDLFKPDNILFDGGRVWLVDWEAAFWNDRYADLAVVANLLVTNSDEERLYLERYFGAPPDDYQLARLFLMRQTARLFYAMAFLLIGASGEPLNLEDAAPDSGTFLRRFWTGEVNLVDKESKLQFGRVHWEQLASNMESSRVKEALRIVADRHRA